MKKPSNISPNHKNLNKSHNSNSFHKISGNAHGASPIRITSGSLRGRALISPRSAETHPMGSREKIALFNMLMAELPQIKQSKSALSQSESPQTMPSQTELPQSESSQTMPSQTELPQSKFQNLRILDAYAGSGALGIEAISRGATNVIFVEKSPGVAKIIRQNLQSLHLSDQNETDSTQNQKILEQNPLASNHFGVRNQSVAEFIRERVKNQSVAEFIRKNSKTSQSDTTRDDSDKSGLFDLILADPPYDHFDSEEISDLATLLTPEGVLALSHPGEAPDLKNLTLLKTRSYARAHLSLYRHN